MQWIPGYEGRYQISDRGEVYSYIKGLPVLLNYNTQGRGKRTVKLIDASGKKTWYQLHRLVALVYLRKPLRGERFVQFKDRNTFNVCASNLEWVHRPEVYSREDFDPVVFYPKSKVQHIRKCYYIGEDTKALARRFGIRQSTVKAIINQRLK